LNALSSRRARAGLIPIEDILGSPANGAGQDISNIQGNV
jgi:hypothetical protein